MVLVPNSEFALFEANFSDRVMMVDGNFGPKDDEEGEEKEDCPDDSGNQTDDAKPEKSEDVGHLALRGGRYYRILGERRYLIDPPMSDPRKGTDRVNEFKSITFFYMHFRPNGQFISYLFEYPPKEVSSEEAANPICEDTIKDFVEKSIEKARKKEAQESEHPSPKSATGSEGKNGKTGAGTLRSTGIDGGSWSAPSYVAFFLDNPEWHLIDRVVEEYDEVRSLSFQIHKVEPKRQSNSKIPGKPSQHQNRSFYRARNIDINVSKKPKGKNPKKGKARFLLVENHHNHAYTKLGPRKSAENDIVDTYKFDLLYRAQVLDETECGNGGSSLVLIIDPSRGNRGP